MFHVIYYFQVIRIYIKREAPISWPCKNYAIEPMKTFLDGQYSIPNYQREYSWEENEIHDFLNDLEDTCANPSTIHFFMDFTLRRDKTTQPPHYIVIFKAKDADNLEQAFQMYCNP